MKKLPVGLQIYSVREDAEKDFKGTIQKVKEIGYEFAELAGLYGLTAQEVRAVLDEAGLPAVSAHVPLDLLMADLEKTINDYVTIGVKFIAIPHLDEDLRPGTPGFDKVMAMIPVIGKACNEKGVTLIYHNHDFEFVRMPDGRYGIDYMYETIDKSLLQSELDCCWVKVSGEDPAAYIRKYAGRCPVVHLKDFYKEGQVADMYQLIGTEAKEKKESTGKFEFRPVGYGMQSVPDLLEAAVDSGAQYLVVEQDSSVGRTSFEAVAMSRNYLKTLGM